MILSGMDRRTCNIVYMGTPDFAVPGLKALVEGGYRVVAVVTAPDKPQGRGLKLQPSPVKEYAVQAGIPVLQPEKLKDPAFLTELQELRADLQIVVAFRMLPEVVWSMPPLGTFNLHASLLPQYRGAAPIHWAVMQGETVTGLTTFFLQHEIDTGDILLQETEPIHTHDTTGSLYERLMHKGAHLILRTVEGILDQSLTPTPQQPVAGTLKHAPKIFKDDAQLDFGLPARQVYNKVRGLNPSPVAFTYLEGKLLKIHRCTVLEESIPVACIRTDNHSFVKVGCGEGSIALEEVQWEGRKRMLIAESLRGNPIKDGSSFGA